MIVVQCRLSWTAAHCVTSRRGQSSEGDERREDGEEHACARTYRRDESLVSHHGLWVAQGVADMGVCCNDIGYVGARHGGMSRVS